jgi:hypothetical protein
MSALNRAVQREHISPVSHGLVNVMAPGSEVIAREAIDVREGAWGSKI